MKVSKEAIIGLLAALQNLTEEDSAKRVEHLRELLWSIGGRVEGIAGVELRMTEDNKGAYPMLKVKIKEKVVGKSATEVVKRLKDGASVSGSTLIQ